MSYNTFSALNHFVMKISSTTTCNCFFKNSSQKMELYWSGSLVGTGCKRHDMELVDFFSDGLNWTELLS